MSAPNPQNACFFTGHRNAPESIRPALAREIERRITQLGVTDFYVGNYGRFDTLVSMALTEAKKRHPEIRVRRAVPYLYQCSDSVPEGFEPLVYFPDETLEIVPERQRIVALNRHLVQRCGHLIAYVLHSSAGSGALLDFARKRPVPPEIVNLAQTE